MLIIPVALTVIAFLVIRSMAKTALRLDDAQAASAAVHAAINQVPQQPPSPPAI
jgi:hypothetical protein